MNFLLISSFTESIPFWLYKNMWSSAGSTGERSFLLLILSPAASIRYWVIHSITIHVLFYSGWLFISQHGFSLRCFCFWKPPRPNEYFTERRQGMNSINNWPAVLILWTNSMNLVDLFRRQKWLSIKLILSYFDSVMVGCSRTSSTYRFFFRGNISNAVHPTRKLIRIIELWHNQIRTNTMLNGIVPVFTAGGYLFLIFVLVVLFSNSFFNKRKD